MTSRQRPAEEPRWTRGLGLLAPIAVVLMGAVATVLVARYEDRVGERDLQRQADRSADIVADGLAALLETQIGSAAATAAALSVDPDLDRAAFSRYAAGIEDQLPTLLGVGYIRRVATEDIGALVASARAGGAAGFEVRDLGTGPDHAILLYNEPADELRQSWGVDVRATEEAARALERATDAGRAAVTSRVVLAVDRTLPAGQQPAGYVAYAPVFAPDSPTATVQERRAGVVGWSNLPFRAQDLLDRVVLPSDVRAVLRDGGVEEPVIAAIGPIAEGRTATSVHVVRASDPEIDWVVETSIPATALDRPFDRPTVALVAGAGLTALLAVLVAMLARGSRLWAYAARRATRQLAESEQQLRATIDAAPDLLLVVDAAGTIASASPRARDLLGIEPGDLHGQPAGRILPGVRDLAALDHRNEHLVPGRDGSPIAVAVTSRPLRPGDPTSPLVLVVRDVTAQRRAKEDLREHSRQLERSNRDLEAIATIAAHDLSEPLTVIGGYADLLVQRYPTASTVDEAAVAHLRTISDAVQRMRAMLDALLHMSSLREEVREPEAVPLAEVVQDAMANVESALTASGAEVVVGPLPTVPGHRDLLVDLVQNLLVNAVRHGGSDRPLRITVDAAREAEGWRITVADSGTGVPPVQRRRIFQAFRRLDGSGPGLGIGLSIARRIVQLHGGRIDVGDAPGGGAAFTFTLPDDAPGPEPGRVGRG